MLCARNRPCLTPRGNHTAVCEAASLTHFPDGKLGSEAALHVQGTWPRAPGTPLPSPPGEGSRSGRRGQKYEIPGSADTTPGRCPLRLSNGALASLTQEARYKSTGIFPTDVLLRCELSLCL